MCFHRKEVCSVCRCPIQDAIVLCHDARNRIAITNSIIGRNSKVVAYTSENVKRIMSIYPHEMPTVERSSSMCQNHYMIALSGTGAVSYEEYRKRMDSWMKI